MSVSVKMLEQFLPCFFHSAIEFALDETGASPVKSSSIRMGTPLTRVAA